MFTLINEELQLLNQERIDELSQITEQTESYNVELEQMMELEAEKYYELALAEKGNF